MPDRNPPNILIEKVNFERITDFYAALNESRQEWFAEGMILKPDMSLEEVQAMLKGFLALWENDNAYIFYILEGTTNQVLGSAFLNNVNRRNQVANLGYLVRTSRIGEGIATEAAKLVAHYGFEELGFQRIEIVVRPENAASLKVAEKLGALREGLLRNRLQLQGSPYNAYLFSLIPTDFDIHKRKSESS